MTAKEVIQILTTHNAWRRGADIEPEDMPTPKQVGDAIHEAVRLLKELQKFHQNFVNRIDDAIKLLQSSHEISFQMTENQITELAQIGSQHLYLGAMEEGRISCDGIMEILKRYEELRKTER